MIPQKGTTSTSIAMNPPPPMLLQHASDRHRCLPIDDAWAIALAWQEPLQGHVLLEVEGETVHKSYAWVRFEPHWIRYDNTPTVSAARAAAVAWFALSCCPGYSGRENPVFWKCVFSEMAPQRVHHDTVPNFRGGPRTRHTDIQSVTDAHGFFDRDGIEFPRFRLPFHRCNAGVRLFCGLPGEQLEPEDEVRLQRIMDQLTPWIDNRRTTRRPVVAFDKLDLSWYAMRDIADERSTECSQVALLQLLSDIHCACVTSPTWPAPTFAVESLAIEGEINAQNAPEVHHLIRQLNEHEVDITLRLDRRDTMTALSMVSLRARLPRHLSKVSVRKPSFHPAMIDQYIDRAVLAAVVHDVLPPPGSRHRSHVTSLDLFGLGQTTLPAILSSLPYATSVHTVIGFLTTGSNERDDRDWAWLGYALFHPDTLSSTWKSLKIWAHLLSDHRIAMLQAMAQGNSLAALLDGEDVVKGRSTNHILDYCRATLAIHASVYTQPKTGLRKRFKAVRLLTTTNTTTAVEVSGVSTDDHRQWDKWVPVVAQGYGLGWVRSADVTRAEMRRPAEATLTSLCLSGSIMGDVGGESLYSFFQLIGQRLVHLQMSCGSDVDLRQVLSNSPSLESLAIPYQSAMWSDSTVSSLLPRLRELELTYKSLEGETMAVTQFPRSLQVLRIIASGRQNPHAYDGIVRQLQSSASALRVFHWQEGLYASLDPTPYTETCADTERRLYAVGVPRAWRHAVLSRLRPSCAAAFLSVAEAQRLDPEVAQIIVAFAGHCGRRSIVLEPQASEIPGERRQRYQLPI